jgi:hypothetical protein
MTINNFMLSIPHLPWRNIGERQLALVDAMLNLHPELYGIISPDILALGKNNEMGRQDGPAVEQVVRAALYKELKGLNYQELEYAQIDSRIGPLFIKLGFRDPFSYEVLHKYITAIRPESLQKWRSGIEAVISYWKRGFQMSRCEWKGLSDTAYSRV